MSISSFLCTRFASTVVATTPRGEGLAAYTERRVFARVGLAWAAVALGKLFVGQPAAGPRGGRSARSLPARGTDGSALRHRGSVLGCGSPHGRNQAFCDRVSGIRDKVPEGRLRAPLGRGTHGILEVGSEFTQLCSRPGLHSVAPDLGWFSLPSGLGGLNSGCNWSITKRKLTLPGASGRGGWKGTELAFPV